MGREIHPDVKRAAVRLSHFFSHQVTAGLLGISDDTVRRAVQLYHETGDVVSSGSGARRGRKAVLDESHKAVSY